MPITRADLLELLDSDLDEPALVLIGGRAEVVSLATLRTPGYAGALLIGARDELRTNLGDDPSERDLDELATRLDMEVASRGA